MLRRILGRRVIEKRSITLEQLEERIVLDVAGGADTQDNPDENQDTSQQTAEDPQAEATGDTQSSGNEASSNPVSDIFDQDLNVVLISNALDQVEALSNAAVDDAVVIVYDAEQDDLATITHMLEDLTESEGKEIGHLAILSHGSTGKLYLGAGGAWTSVDLQTSADAWAAFGNLLTEDARIDVYSCSVGNGIAGEYFVQVFSEVTGATVWASDDETGNVDGSDWDFEVKTALDDSDFLIETAQLDGLDIDLAVDTTLKCIDTDDTAPLGYTSLVLSPDEHLHVCVY